MKRVELLAPAGDLQKAKYALIYGADAVYIGGKSFSLRYFASNFTNEDIFEAVKFAHNLNKKVYVTVNMVMHDENLSGLKEYLIYLKSIEVDAVIASSIYVLEIGKEIGLEVHMSTQLSILNEEAVNLYYKLGSKRIVLGRELSLEEIKNIKKNTDAEIEVFIHGGMCSSYSGRCMLSHYMCDRDPNRGGCAHSCRWKYHLLDSEGEYLYSKDKYMTLSSKDLCAIREIPELISAGVSSLKIEGRMKSLNYLAFIISSYRKCIDDYYDGKKLDFDLYQKFIVYGENRLTGHGFLHGEVTVNESLLDLNDNFDHAGEFIGSVVSYDKENKHIIFDVKNKIVPNEKYLVISPGCRLQEIEIGNIFYKGETVDKFTIAQEIVELECDIEVEPYSLVHKMR